MGRLVRLTGAPDPERADPEKARSTDFGNYVGAVFRLKAGGKVGDSVATLWAEENGAWKIAQYNLSVPIPNDKFGAVRRIIGP